jgi:hypothetical protein
MKIYLLMLLMTALSVYAHLVRLPTRRRSGTEAG